MNQTIEQIKPETVRMIESKAKLAGLSIDEYLKGLVTNNNGHEAPFYETATPEELVEEFLDWARSHDPNIPALSLEDISRDSIY